MSRIGYVRTRPDQDRQPEVARLREAGCDIVRVEDVSENRRGRDELAALMRLIRDGDELVVVKLDRLGRSLGDVLNLLQGLEARGAALAVLEPAFSTRDGAGSVLATVLKMATETERTFSRERRQAGIEAAKKAGVYGGRKPSVPVARVRDMRAAGHGPSAIAKALGISRMSVYRALTASDARHLSGTGLPGEAPGSGADRNA